MQVENKKIAYFDNAATTYIKPKEVHDFMRSFYSANSVNVGRGAHQLLNSSNRLIADTRKNIVKLFNGNSDHVAVFTATATEAINIILQGSEFCEGDNIYVSPFEHNSVYRVLHHVVKTKKINIIVLSVDRETLEFNFSSIRNQFIDNAPKMVVVTHVSNVCGNVAPLERIGELVKEFNAIFVVDCAQSAGLLETDIVASRADYMVFAGHKTLYGAFGCSGFICSKSSRLKPLIIGGTGTESASENMPDNIPERFEAGSKNIMAIAGLHSALEWQNRIGRDMIREKEKANYKELINVLSKYDFIHFAGNSDNSISILSCAFSGYAPDEVERVLSDKGIIVRSGLHCAPLAHKFLGTFPAGTVRFSVSYFTCSEDFAKLREALNEF